MAKPPDIAEIIAEATAEGAPVDELARRLREATKPSPAPRTEIVQRVPGPVTVTWGDRTFEASDLEIIAESDRSLLDAGVLSADEVRRSWFGGITMQLNNANSPAASRRWDAPVEPDQILRDIQSVAASMRVAPIVQPSIIPIVPIAFERLEAMDAPIEMTAMTMRTGGVVVRSPAAMAYMDAFDGEPETYEEVVARVVWSVGRRTVRVCPYVEDANPPNPGITMRINGRKVARQFLGSLASRYGVIEWIRPRIMSEQDGRAVIGNRHHAKRWLRMFAQVAAVASDALEADQPRACFAMLCEHITLDDALRLVYGPPSDTPMVAVKEYTNIEDVERAFGTGSREYETSLAIMTRGTVWMESDTPLELGDLVAAGDQPNRVRLAEIEDLVAGIVTQVNVSGDAATDWRYLVAVRVGDYGAAYHWERAVAAAYRDVPKVTADDQGISRLLWAALEVARRWDPEVEGRGFDAFVNSGQTTYQLGARLFGETVYATVNT